MPKRIAYLVGHGTSTIYFCYIFDWKSDVIVPQIFMKIIPFAVYQVFCASNRCKIVGQQELGPTTYLQEINSKGRFLEYRGN
jgi:hypothetical protein